MRYSNSLIPIFLICCIFTEPLYTMEPDNEISMQEQEKAPVLNLGRDQDIGLAILNDSVEELKPLLADYLDRNLKYSDSCLSFAVQEDKLNIVNFLVENYSGIVNDGHVNKALQKSSVACVDSLLQAPQVKITSEVLATAIFAGEEKRRRILCDRRTNVSDLLEWFPLDRVLCSSDSDEIFKELIEHHSTNLFMIYGRESLLAFNIDIPEEVSLLDLTRHLYSKKLAAVEGGDTSQDTAKGCRALSNLTRNLETAMQEVSDQKSIALEAALNGSKLWPSEASSKDIAGLITFFETGVAPSSKPIS